MASEDEVDYMSDSFLESVCGKEDIRPGLIKSYSQKYEHTKMVNKMKFEEKNRIHNPSIKQKEVENRDHGLSKPLDSDNVGFKLLQKLGFKPGSGLGKSGEGRIEPVSVDVKVDRQGLGRKSSLEEISRMRAKFRAEAKEKLLNINDYRLRKAGQAAEKRALLDLNKSQRVCWELDSKESIEEPAESWFWPESKLPQFDDTEEEQEADVENNSETCHEHENESTEASSDSCKVSGSAECENDDEEEYEDETFSVQEKLEMLTLYLRKTYLYCVWCGHSFDDEKDLQQECPGPSREDH